MIKFSKLSAITTAGYFPCPTRRDEKSPPNYWHLNIIILAGHPLKFCVFYLVPLDVSSVEQRYILFAVPSLGKKTKVKLASSLIFPLQSIFYGSGRTSSLSECESTPNARTLSLSFCHLAQLIFELFMRAGHMPGKISGASCFCHTYTGNLRHIFLFSVSWWQVRLSLRFLFFARNV